jgi:hypothetical protein
LLQRSGFCSQGWRLILYALASASEEHASMGPDKPPHARTDCTAPTLPLEPRLGLHGRPDGLVRWLEGRPLLVRLALVAVVSLLLWAVILAGAASLLRA